jgi:hypothetical protein
MTNECGAVGGMRISKGIQSTPRKSIALPLCRLQIPYNLILDQILATTWEADKLSLPTCNALNCDAEVNENLQTNITVPLTRM